MQPTNRSFQTIYFFAEQCKMRYESPWRQASSLSGSILDVACLALKTYGKVHQKPTIEININTKANKTQKTEETEEEKKKREEENELFLRIGVTLTSVLGIAFLSHAIGKDAAKLSEAEEALKTVNTDDVASYPGLHADATNLIDRVKKNTLHLRIVPNIVILAGCVFALLGALNHSKELIKGGALFGIGGLAVKLFVNSLYANEDREIYNLAERISTGLHSFVYPEPSAPQVWE